MSRGRINDRLKLMPLIRYDEDGYFEQDDYKWENKT